MHSTSRACALLALVLWAGCRSAPVAEPPTDVQEQVTLQLRQGAAVCLVHLHGDEHKALGVARDAYRDRCANLLHVQGDTRGITLQAGDTTCTVDPNRVFTEAGRAQQVARCEAPEDAPALAAALERWFAAHLAPKVAACTDGRTLPVVAYHDNRWMPIEVWAAPDGREAAGAERDPERLAGLPNPRITGRHPQDWILVTRPEDFRLISALPYNAVLQVASPPDDGSLSVALASDRYFNIEADRSTPDDVQRAASEDLLNALGVPSTCPAIDG